MSLLAALQGNLRTIALEAKKNEVLKDAAERALQKLLKETSTSEEDLSKALASNDDILKPFMLACRDTKDPKLVASSVASIQILISHNAVNPKSLSVVVRILADQVTADEPVQYKILQAVVALLTSSTAIHDKDLAKAIAVCFKLQSGKNPNLRGTATATVRQIVVMCFDRACAENGIRVQRLEQSEAAVGADRSRLGPLSTDAFRLLRDLYSIVAGQPADWMEVSGCPPEFALELMDGIFRDHSKLFVEVPRFTEYLRDQIFPLVASCFSKTGFSFTVRLARTVASLVAKFAVIFPGDCEGILTKLLELLLAVSSAPWTQALALETFAVFLGDPEIIRSLYLRTDSRHKNIFLAVTTGLSKYTRMLVPTWQPALELVTNRPRCSEQLSTSEPPPIEEDYLATTLADCVANVVQALPVLRGRDPEVVQQLAEDIWTPVMLAVEQLLSRTRQAAFTQLLLNIYQELLSVCCALRLSTARDALLNAVRQFTLPVKVTPDSVSDLTAHLTSQRWLGLRLLLFLAQSSAETLEKAGWVIVLEALGTVETALGPHIQGTGRPLVFSQTVHLSAAEVGQMHAEVAAVFEETRRWELPLLCLVLEALEDLSYASTMKVEDRDSSSHPLMEYSLWAVRKVAELAALNVARLDLIWPYCSKPLLAVVAGHKNAHIRLTTLGLLSKVVNLGMKEDASKASQPELIRSYQILATRQGHADTRERAIRALEATLHAFGNIMTEEAWVVVLDTMKEIAEDKNLRDTISLAFGTVKFICTDFFVGLEPPCALKLLAVIGAYGLQPHNVNVSLSSVELLLAIADNISKGDLKTSQEYDLDYFWFHLLVAMRPLGIDDRPEVRNCVVITLFKTLVTHGRSLNAATWPRVLWEVLVPLLSEIKAYSRQAGQAPPEAPHSPTSNFVMLVHHSRDTAQKQWDETQVHALGGLGVLMRSYFPLLYTTLPDKENLFQLWDTVVGFIEESTIHSSPEVAVSGISAFQKLFGSQAELAAAYPREFWDRAWQGLSHVAGSLGRPEGRTDDKTRRVLATALRDIYSKTEAYCRSADRSRLLHISHPLLLYPEDISPNRLSPAQTELFKLAAGAPRLTSDVSRSDDGVTLPVFLHLCSLLPAGADTLPVQYAPLAEATVVALCELFERSTLELRAKVFPDVLRVLGLVLQTKFAEGAKVWDSTTAAFCSMVPRGLAALPTGSEAERATYGQHWARVCDYTQGALFREPKTEQQFIALVAELLPAAEAVPQVPDRLLSILVESTRRQAAFGSLAQGGWQALVRLTAAPSRPCAERVFAVFLARAAEVLATCEAEPDLPEVLFLLQLLADAEFEPSLAQPDTPAAPGARQLHLCRLFKLQALVRALTADRPEIRRLVQQLLAKVADQLPALQ